MNTKNKTEDFIYSEFFLKEFSDINLENYLNTHRQALNVEGTYDIGETLFLFDSANENYTKNYEDIDEKIFQSESLDPKKEEYLPENYFSQTKVWKTIDRALTKLINKENKGQIIFLACAKSTGKTLSQNIWIRKNDTLMEENKIFWIRCDSEKLMHLVESFGIDKISHIEGDIISSYFDIQFLSVLCKHYKSERNPFFQQIFKELDRETIALRVSGDHKEPVYNDKLVRVLDIIEEYHNTILREKDIKGQKYNYGREVILKSALNPVNKSLRAFENWRNLSKKIQKILISKGYKFLRIIDSVDNYTKYDKDGNYQIKYRFILDKICDFNFNYVENQIHEGSVAIFCRINTYWDYKAFYNHTKKLALQTSYLHHNLIELNEEELERDNMSIQNKRYEFLIKEISLKSKTLDIFKKIINYTTSEQPFLNKFLRNEKHIGYLLRNKVYLLPALIYFQKKYNMSNEKLDDFIKCYFPSNLLLNGYFSLNSFSIPKIDQGRMLFNIFYYENENDSKWQGLCCSRILQYLKNNGDFLKDDLIEKIHQLFCYDKNTINHIISMLTEFSLLRLVGLNENNNNNVNNPKLCITDKGQACLDLIYSDFDILYHCSLDTSIPKSLIIKKFIHPHSNELEIRNYAICCLKSTLSFIQYLKKVDREERVYIDNLNIGINSQDYLLPLSANSKIQENLVKRLKFLEESLNENAKEELEKFKNCFKEIHC